jgi:hypothetical protein
MLTNLPEVGVEETLKYDCPWCGVSLKWRLLHSKPLSHPPYSTPTCPVCEGRLLRTKQELKNKAGWLCWNAALLFVTFNVIIWVKIRMLDYACITLFMLLTVTIYIYMRKRERNDNVDQSYCKYTESEEG